MGVGSARDGSERRQDRRQPTELKVEYRRLNSFFSEYTANISKGGTFIKTEKPFAVGTEFVFRLRIPELAEAIEMRGQVQWVVGNEKPDDGGSGAGKDRCPPGMGIRFLFRDDSERDRIQQVIEQLMVDSLGPELHARLMERSRKSGPTSGNE